MIIIIVSKKSIFKNEKKKNTYMNKTRIVFVCVCKIVFLCEITIWLNFSVRHSDFDNNNEMN